jgi:hypothetical protein
MAVDLLSIPAMSAEPGRLFSECKRILTPDRESMHADTLEAVEGLKSFNRRRRLKKGKVQRADGARRTADVGGQRAEGRGHPRVT